MSEGRGQIALVFVLLTLIWGTTWAAIRIALEGIPPLAGVSFRFALAGVLLLGWAKWRGVKLVGSRAEWRIWSANALFTFIAAYGLIYWAEQRIPSGLAAVIFASFPLWVVVLGWFVLPEERADWRQLVGVVVGFGGIAVLYSEDLDAELGPGAALAATALLAAPFCSAIGNVLIKRWGKGIRPEVLASMPMLLAGLALLPISWSTESWRGLSAAPRPWLATIYLAAIGSAVTFPLYFWLLTRRSAVSASLVAYTAPVVAVAVGVGLFGEPLTPRLVAGAALILGGVAGALAPRRRPAAA